VTVPQATLACGVKVPLLGLGVYGIDDSDTQHVVETALELGYRHFDTAASYGNERGVGAGVANAPRTEVFVTTKLWITDMGYEAALAAFERSRQRLGLDYVDLFLIHWPHPELSVETWRAMERLLNDGWVRAIGVSNFQPEDLASLAGFASVTPAVNQLEINPFCYRTQLRVIDATRQAGIHTTAYRPLAKGARLSHPTITAVAGQLDRTPAQVLLRWVLDHGFSVVVKSSSPTRLAQNLNVFGFTLPGAAMAALEDLDEGLLTAKNSLVEGH